MTLVLALDAGGTSTRALLVDDSGRCRGYGRGGSGNPISSGPEVAGTSLAASGLAALAVAQERTDAVGLVLVAAAGAGSGTHRDELVRRLADAGLDAPCVFASDLLATFCSGTHLRQGYAVVAGTGAAAIRVEEGTTAAVADGLGWLLGDVGSGFWIGRRVARAVVADLDRRGAATALTPLLRARLGVAGELGAHEAAQAIARLLYADLPVRLADLAALAFECAGDRVADEIVTAAAEGLATSLRAVDDPAVRGPLVLGGGVLSRSRALQEGVRRVGTVVVHDGAVGAAVLALRQTGVAVDEQVFVTLARSVAAVR